MRRIEITSQMPREIAVYEDGKLCEYLLDDGEGAGTDAVILGRVERVVKGMNAAFVNIGQEKNGFLPLNEKSESFSSAPLREGMRIAVQVKREAHEQKGAFLSRDITLCGVYVILMPLNRYIGVSSRIEGEGQRSRLRSFGREIADGRFGLIMRLASANAPEEAIVEEIDGLLSQWQIIQQDILAKPAPSVIYQPDSFLGGILRDYSPRGIDEIVTDDAAMIASLRNDYTVRECEPDIDEMHRQRDKAFERFVWLKSGGSLIIDQCEAMTVIDVNSGKFTGKRLMDDTILQLNIEACAEISRQLRLRAIGGVIVIDFIDMKREEDKAKVLEALSEACAADRVVNYVHGFTTLGLVEMTRRRSRQSLREQLTVPCSCCNGSGRIIPKEESHG